MKKIILLIISVFLFAGEAHSKRQVVIDAKYVKRYKQEAAGWSQEQKSWLTFVYSRCIKYNLGNTCVAIAWEESQFNVYGVIPETGDYGIMGINLYWFLRDNNLNTRNRYVRNKWATRLVKDDEYNLMYAIAKLQKLKDKYHNWYSVWAHYNGGTTPNWEYAKRILNRIYVFRKVILGE